jgi:hypothetical protein
MDLFCSKCGYDLQNGQASNNVNPLSITGTQDGVFVSGFPGDKNIIAKDIQGNFFIFNIGAITTEQVRNIIMSSTSLCTLSNRDIS